MDESRLREQLLRLLDGGEAHIEAVEAVRAFPRALTRAALPDVEHTPWQLLEHLRIAQNDILEFSRDPRYVSPPWPAGYWPREAVPPDEQAWPRSVEAFCRDLAAMQALVRDPRADLFTPFAHGQGQTLLREALLVADHNAYHLGQLVLLRKALAARAARTRARAGRTATRAARTRATRAPAPASRPRSRAARTPAQSRKRSDRRRPGAGKAARSRPAPRDS